MPCSPQERLAPLAAAVVAAVALGAPTALAQGPGTAVGVASVIGGGFQTTEWTYQHAENCGGGVDRIDGDRTETAITTPPSVLFTAVPGSLQVAPIPSIPVAVTVERSSVYFGPERLNNCDSPTAEEDCGAPRTTSADLALVPYPGGIELRGGARPRQDPYRTCYRPATVIDYPELVPARGPIPSAAVVPGPLDLTLELRGGPAVFSLPFGSGTTTSSYTLRLIGAVAPLLSLGGPGDARTVRSRRGAAPVPVECSTAGGCRATLALRPERRAGGRAARTAAARAAAAERFPLPVPERARGDIGPTRITLKPGSRRTVRLPTGARRGRFRLVVAQETARRTIAYAAGVVTVRR